MTEPIDFEEQWSDRFWGAYTEEGYPSDPPVALFGRREWAEEWLALESTQEEFGANLVILRTDLHATYWNGPDSEDPKKEGFQHFTFEEET